MTEQNFDTWVMSPKPEPGDPQERVGDSDFPPNYFQPEPRPPELPPDQPAQKESPSTDLRRAMVVNLANFLHARLKHMAGRHNQKRHGWRYSRGIDSGGLSGRDVSRALEITAGPTRRHWDEAKRIVAASTSMHRTPEVGERSEYRKRAGLVTPPPKISKKPEVKPPAPKPPKPPKPKKAAPDVAPAPTVDIPYRPSKDLQKEIYASHDEWLVNHGFKREDLSKHRRDLESELKEICDAAPLVVRSPAAGARGIIRDGRFKSQFESGTSEGSLSPTSRSRAENTGLGVPTSIAANQRPIYGYLRGATTDTYDYAQQYGEVMFYVKPTVRSRTTVTLGDSLGAMGSASQIGTPLIKPNLGSVRKSGSFTGVGTSKPHINRGVMYFETQIHKGLSLGDIASVHFTSKCFSGSTLKNAYKEIEASLKAKGIEIVYEPTSD